jgi:ABC-type amino acid transport substrate-binding protein
MKKLLPVLMFFCALLMMWTAPIQAKELRVGLGELDYPPFYFEKDGNLHGAAIEITQHIAQKLGHTLVFRRYPWARVQLYLKTGDVDAVILYFKTPEREKDVVFTDIPHLYESSSLFVAKGTETPFNGTLSDLWSYRFGNVRGYSHGKEYDGAEYLNKHIVNNETLLIRMLVKGRIDIAVGNKPAIIMYAKQEGLHDKITFLTPPIDKAPNFFAFSKSRKDAAGLAKEFSTEVKKIIASERYQHILKRYGLDLPE